MTDDFLRAAQAEWRRTPADVPALHRRLRRRRWAPHAALALEVAGAAAAFAIGLVFLVLALRTREPLFALSAFALLAAMPLAIDASIRARRHSLRWADETPRSVVTIALHRAEASIRVARIGRWGVATVAAFTAALWVARAASAIAATPFVLVYSGAALAVCLPYLWYLRHRERAATRERAACLALLEDLDR